jgi:peroxiredoxin
MSRFNKGFFVFAPVICFAVLVFGLNRLVYAGTADFRLHDLSGQTHTLDDYRGRWLLVNYWATWCPPCLEELPELEVFHNTREGGAAVLGVNMENIAEPRLRRFVEEQFLSFPILPASARPQPHELVGPVEALPTSYLITPAGEIIARQVGQVTAEGISDFIDRYEQNHGEVKQ